MSLIPRRSLRRAVAQAGDGSPVEFVELKGDSDAPGNSMVYGTDGSGDRGWQAAGGGSGLTHPQVIARIFLGI